MMELTYTRNNVTNSPNDGELVTAQEAQALASLLGGIVVDMVQVVSPGALTTLTDASGTRAWNFGDSPGLYGVTCDPKRYPSVYTPIFCYILKGQGWSLGQAGQFHANALNGNPQWVPTPPPPPAPPPPPVHVPNVIPGIDSQPAEDRIGEIKSEIDKIFAAMQKAGWVQ